MTTTITRRQENDTLSSQEQLLPFLLQHPTEEIEAWGRIDRLRISTDENFRQTREFVGTPASSSLASTSVRRAGVRGPVHPNHRPTISRPAFDALRFYTDQFHARHQRLFASRIKERRSS